MVYNPNNNSTVIALGDFMVNWQTGYTADVPGEVVTGVPLPPALWMPVANSLKWHPIAGAKANTEFFSVAVHWAQATDVNDTLSQWFWSIPTSGGAYVEYLNCMVDLGGVNPVTPVAAVENADWDAGGLPTLAALSSTQANSLALALFIDDDFGYNTLGLPTGWTHFAYPNWGEPSYNPNCCAIDAFSLSLPNVASTGPVTTTMGGDSGYGALVILNGTP